MAFESLETRWVPAGLGITPDLTTPPTGFDAARANIAHGNLQAVSVQSTVDGGTYNMSVYTPPNYSTAQKYPVLYLLHGASGNENTWANDVNAANILDNLYADGKAEPRIVVMPSSYSVQARARGSLGVNAQFESVLVTDMTRYVESRYAASTSRNDRALAGLSMGAGQAFNTGLGRPDVFSSVGAFSGANTTRISGSATVDVSSPGRALNLFWLSTGDADTVTGPGVMAADSMLTTKGIAHEFHVSAGGHEVPVWKTDLYYFGQRLKSAVTADTTPPAAPAVALTQDTGSSNTDRVTNNAALTLGNLEAGAVVEYSTNGGAAWTKTFTAVAGANTVLVRQTDLAGNVGRASAAFTFTLDKTAPAAPTVTLTQDTGSSRTDRVTTNGALTLSNVEAGAVVEYSTDGGRTWVKTFVPVAGRNAVLVRQTDVAGNVGMASAAFVFTLVA